MTVKQVVIYSTPTCPYCRRAKDYLTRKGISYTEYNVAADRAAAKEMVKKSGQLGVPVILIDGDGNAVAAAGHGLVNAIVGNLVDQMVQSALVGAADVHSGTAAHRLPSAQDLDVFGGIFIIIDISFFFMYSPYILTLRGIRNLCLFRLARY